MNSRFSSGFFIAKISNSTSINAEYPIPPRYLLAIASGGIRADIYFEGVDEPVIVDLCTYTVPINVNTGNQDRMPACTYTVIPNPLPSEMDPVITEEQKAICAERTFQRVKKDSKGPKPFALARQEFEAMGIPLPEKNADAKRVLDDVKSRVYRLIKKARARRFRRLK